MIVIASMVGCSDSKPAQPRSLEVSSKPGAVTQKTSSAQDEAASIYDRTCSLCHGPDGHGRGAAKGVEFVGPDGVLSKSDEVLARSIKEGVQGDRGVMPPFGQALSDEQIAAVLAHVRSRFQK